MQQRMLLHRRSRWGTGPVTSPIRLQTPQPINPTLKAQMYKIRRPGQSMNEQTIASRLRRIESSRANGPLFVMLARTWPDYAGLRKESRFLEIVSHLALPGWSITP